MDIQTQSITIFIAVGNTSARIIDHFQRMQSHFGSYVSDNLKTRHLLCGITQDHNNPNKGQIFCRTLSTDTTRHFRWTKNYEILKNLHDLLTKFLYNATHFDDKTENLGNNILIDVIVAGNAEDELFLNNFHPIILTIEEVVHGKFDAISRVKGDTKNASFILFPIILTENLRTVTNKQKLLALILCMKDWHNNHEIEYKYLPRLYIFDGFARNTRTDLNDQVHMVSDLISLLIDPGLRHTPEMRRLVGFSTYDEDFIAIISIASITFPVHLLSNYCCSHSLLSFFSGLLGNKKNTDKNELESLFYDLKNRLKIDSLEKIFADSDSGFDLIGMLSKSVPKFHYFSSSVEGKKSNYWDKVLPKINEELYTEQNSIISLSTQETYLPLLNWRETPESLSSFFSKDWQDYPKKKLLQSENTEINERFKLYHEAVDACGVRLQENIENELSYAIDQSLSLHGGYNRLIATLDYLKRDIQPIFKKNLKSWEKNKSFIDLPNPPNLKLFSDQAKKFRTLIWNRAPIKVLILWLPVFAFLFFLAFYHFFALANEYITANQMNLSLLSKLISFPFNIPFGLILSGILIILPMLIYNYFVGTKMRRYSRSEYPFKVESIKLRDKISNEKFGRKQLIKSEKILQKINKKIIKYRKRQGTLARCIVQSQKEYRIFWQARLKLATIIWVTRILKNACDMVENEISKLENLRITIDKQRGRIVEKLRRSGDTLENPDQSTVIPSSTPFHAYLLNNDILKKFKSSQRSIKDDKTLSRYLLTRYQLFSGLRKHTIFKQQELLFEMIWNLYPAFKEGIFKNDEYEDLVNAETDNFFSTLETRLSAGDQFRFFASLEENSIVIDTGVYVFCHNTAKRYVQLAMNSHALNNDKLVSSATNRNRITAVRILQDISTHTLLKYFDFELKHAVDQHDTAIADIWGEIRIDRAMEP